MLGEESGIRETFWPTVGMVEPALGGRGPLGRYSDLTFSRSVYAGERVQGGREGGSVGGDKRFSQRCRDPEDWVEADQRWQMWTGERNSRRNV